MVNYLTALLFVLPIFLFSGEFTASVSQNQIHLGESLTLNLTLKDASAKGMPSIDSLKKSFSIHSQQQLFQTVMTNGKMSSNTTWKLTLIPQQEGETNIPSIQIQTSEGILSTDPITIQVVKGTNAHSPSSNHDIILTTDVNNVTPYKNEPFIYTVKIVSKKDLANIKMQKLEVDNAIVEPNGEPKVYQKIVDGIQVGVIEIEYLMTPLKAGTLKIPSLIIEGMTPVKRKSHSGSFFDDDFDLFSMMQGFDPLQPFTLTTEELSLEVQPAISGMTPWLPAKSLKIEETWNDSQTLQVGEPFTRGFKLSVEGLPSSQLPNLNHFQSMDKSFKIYADQPEMGDEKKEGKIKSHRKEHYTFIPQEPGTFTLPELSIAWWDVTKKEKVITRLPARTVQILPAPENSLKPSIPSTEKAPLLSKPQDIVPQDNSILYAIIFGFIVLFLIAIFWIFFLQKKIKQLTKISADVKQEKYLRNSHSKGKGAKIEKKETLPDLNPM